MSKGSASDHHTHKDGTKGHDIYIKDEKGKTVHKMHSTDSDDSTTKSVLGGIAEAAASVFDSLFGKK